jgi:methenyltetrahydromethanopterin cyclohydrolase
MTPPIAAADPRAARPSVNARTAPLVAALIADADALRLTVDRPADGPCVVDAGIACRGGIEAGRRIAEICLGGLGHVSVDAGDGPSLSVHTDTPVLACLASQYAGWSLAHGEGKAAFHALGSGPARAIARREPLFDEIGYADRHDVTCLVLEVDRVPPPGIVDKVAAACGLEPRALTFVLTPTRSLAGMTQVVARVLEVALHKAHALGFPLGAIVDGTGSAPLPSPGADFLVSMGRSNDAILFGGRVHLYVDTEDEAARDLAMRLPSSASRDYGRPFAEVFKDVNYDFYKIDPMLFAPACVTVSNLNSGRTFRAGRVDSQALASSFGIA